MKKRNLKIGLITGITSLIIILILSLLRFGYEELTTNEEHREILVIFTPIWAIALGYCGYGLSKKFYTQKDYILGEDYPNASEEKKAYWKNYKRLMYSNVFNICAKILLIVVPIYILAYLDDSKYLPSNIPFIILLLAGGISCFIISKYLKNKYERNSDL